MSHEPAVSKRDPIQRAGIIIGVGLSIVTALTAVVLYVASIGSTAQAASVKADSAYSDVRELRKDVQSLTRIILKRLPDE